MRVTKGDYRQLADALFHSGTGPGVVSEYKDAPNRLHFYVLGKKRDASGVLSYRVAVRSLDGAGPATRGIAVSEANASPASPGRVAIHRFRVTNTGAAEDLIRRQDDDRGRLDHHRGRQGARRPGRLRRDSPRLRDRAQRRAGTTSDDAEVHGVI